MISTRLTPNGAMGKTIGRSITGVEMPTSQRPDSLPAKLYLLARGAKPHNSSSELGRMLRGAALVELSLRGLLTPDETNRGRVKASGSSRTGDPLLDGLLREIEESRPRGWSAWIRRGNQRTVCAVRDQLAGAGVITVESTTSLGIFRRRVVRVTDPALLSALRDRVQQILRGSRPAGEVDPADAALVAIAAAGRLRFAMSGHDVRDYRRRIDELAERGGAAVPALRRVLREVRTARAAAAGGG